MENLKSHFKINYPNPKDDYSQTSDKGSLKEPIIMLFGWIGASDRYLKTYSQFYEDKGYPTVTLTVSPIIVIFKHNEMVKYSDKLMALLDEPRFKDRPIIIHLFSNGGAFQYEIFSEILQKNQDKSKLLKGVILDSGPTKFTVYTASVVIEVIFRSVVRFRLFSYPLTLAVTVFAFLHHNVMKIQRHIFQKAVPYLDPYYNLINQDNLCPQLFIYSKADRLVSYRDLEVFIDRRIALGVDVTTKIYENTSHVKHYPSDKLGYCKTVFRFLNKVLKK